MEKEKLLKVIEELRKEIHQMMKKKKSFDEEMLEKSQKLDQLLNEYQKLIERK